MKIAKLIPLVLLIILLIGCSTLYIPVPSEKVTISEGHGIIKTDELVLAIANKYWVKEPQELTDYFITFFISFRNLSSEKTVISPEDISLLDENGNQYDIVLPVEVMELLIPEEILFDQFEEQDDEVYEAWKEAKNNLLMETFNFGNILPNAQKTGFIFFPKLKSKNRSCQIVFRDHSVGFIREE